MFLKSRKGGIFAILLFLKYYFSMLDFLSFYQCLEIIISVAQAFQSFAVYSQKQEWGNIGPRRLFVKNQTVSLSLEKFPNLWYVYLKFVIVISRIQRGVSTYIFKNLGGNLCFFLSMKIPKRVSFQWKYEKVIFLKSRVRRGKKNQQFINFITRSGFKAH